VFEVTKQVIVQLHRQAHYHLSLTCQIRAVLINGLPAQEWIVLAVNFIPDVGIVQIVRRDLSYIPRLVQPLCLRVYNGVNVLHFGGGLAYPII
jgi:hypothetical protein